MGSNAKFLFFVVLSFIAVQVVLSHPNFNPKVVERDIIKNADDVIKDIAKEIRNQENKNGKDLQKLLKKHGLNSQLIQCLNEAHEAVRLEMQEENEAVNECCNNVKESIRAALGPDSTLSDILVIRMQHKENIKECKNDSKNKVRELRDEFRLKASQCVLG